jgi:uncharacterized membrane protein
MTPLIALLTFDRAEAPLIWLTLIIILFAGSWALYTAIVAPTGMTTADRSLRFVLGPGLLVYALAVAGFRLFNPRVGPVGLDEIQEPWIWLALVIAGGWLLYTTYQEFLAGSDRRLTWWLLALRGAGLFALLVALVKPAWTSTNELVDAGRVAVIVDNSASMTLPDVSGRPRYTLAREAVEKLRKSVQSVPGARLEIDLFDINGEPLADNRLPEQATLPRTDLARAVRETNARSRSKPLVGVVLVSDGMDNTGRTEFREVADSPVPIYGVGFRSSAEAGGFDLAVRDVRAPERAMVNNEIKIDVAVSRAGQGGDDAVVEIKRGQETFASKKVKFSDRTPEQRVSLTFTPRQAGSFVYTAAIKGEAGERNQTNNARHFPLRVDAEKIRVLYVEGFLRPEFKFLKNRLEDDPDVHLQSVVRLVNPEERPTQRGRDLITPERLKVIDVVILGDIEADYFNSAEYDTLVRWLDEKGHAVLVLGGYRSFGPDGFRKTKLAEALPVVFSEAGPYQSEEPFDLELTEDGKRHPIFDLSSDRVKDAASWATVPGLSGMSLVQRVKPGATVLAVNPRLLDNDKKPTPVVAVQRFGAGHSMVLCVDTTWRWTRIPRVYGRSDTPYARFWSQTIRWLSGRSQDDQRPLLTVSTDRPDYDVGKPVTVKVARQPRPDTDLSTTEVVANVTGPDGKVIALPVKAGSAEPDVFVGNFTPSAGGRYEVTAALNQGTKPIANQASEFLVHGSDLELADPGTNPDNLKAMAKATGGSYFDVAEIDGVVKEIPRKERREVRVQKRELWNSPVLFGFFLAAITVEWCIRRKNHLV